MLKNYGKSLSGRKVVGETVCDVGICYMHRCFVIQVIVDNISNRKVSS